MGSNLRIRNTARGEQGKLASAAISISSVSVIANALRLRQARL